MSTSINFSFAGLLLALSLTGCQPAAPDAAAQVAAAEQRVLATHDSVMSQMDALYSYRQKLQALPPADTARTAPQRRALLGAESAMMGWMHQYRRPADTVTAPRRLQYYARQQQQIDSVAGLIRRSLAAARGLLPASPSTSR